MPTWRQSGYGSGSGLTWGFVLWLLTAVLPAGSGPARAAGTDPGAAPTAKPLVLSERQAQTAAGKYALVVGIDHYASLDIAQLHYSEADARAVADELVRYCGYPRANVLLLLGAAATQEAILTQLDALSNAQLYGGADTLLLYFSGHGGIIDGRGPGTNALGVRDNYLIPYDGSLTPAMIQLRNIPLEQIKLALDRSQFQRKVVLVDACRNELRLGARGAGQGFDETTWADRYGSAQGLKLIVGTQSGQVSWEDPSLGHGIFTYYLLQGLKGAAADEYGVVTVGRLAEYIEGGMSAYSRQNPTRIQLPTLLGEGMVNIPLAVVDPHAPPPASEPAPSGPPALANTAPVTPANFRVKHRLLADSPTSGSPDRRDLQLFLLPPPPSQAVRYHLTLRLGHSDLDGQPLRLQLRYDLEFTAAGGSSSFPFEMKIHSATGATTRRDASGRNATTTAPAPEVLRGATIAFDRAQNGLIFTVPLPRDATAVSYAVGLYDAQRQRFDNTLGADVKL